MTPMRWLMIFAAAAATLSAQTAAPNAAGVSAGHIHIEVPDPDAMINTVANLLGGEKVSKGPLNMVKLPNIFVIVTPNQNPAGGTNASTVHHVGFMVKDFAAIKAKAEAQGLAVQELVPNVQAFINLGSDVMIEVQQDENVKHNVEFHHFHMQSPNPPPNLAWYMENFGGQPGERRNQPVALIPGGEVDFLPGGMGGGGKGKGKGKAAAPPPAPTKGRALDHIGFEVVDLPAFIAKLKANGVNMDVEMLDMTEQFGLKIAFLTDPNGTYIELTEGLDDM